MVPSSGSSRPRIRVVSYPSGDRRSVSVIAWIAGPPMFSREMIRARRTGVTSRRRGELTGAQAVPEVLDGSAEPLAQLHGRLVAEVLPRPREVGERMPDVAHPRRGIDRLEVAVDELAQLGKELLESDRLAAGHVVDPSRRDIRI